MRLKIYLFTTFLIILIFSSFDTNHSENVYKTKITYRETKSKKIAKKVAAIPAKNAALYNDKFNSILHKYRFNGTALVVKKGEIIFKTAQGYSNLKTKTPLTENTTFQLASVSKQFTAMAVMILHEQGKLQYEDLVTKYIPDFPYKNITIKNLLSHTSGVPNYIYLIDTYWPKDKPITNEDVLTLFKSHTLPLNFKPGNRFFYSNTGYVFLGLLVERVSKQPFKSFLKTHIFDKLGMSNTFVYDKNKINSITNRALSYQVRRRYVDQIEENITDDIPGDKGIFSTVDDLYKWDKALYDNSIVREATINEAYEGVTLNNNKTRDYGYGWRIKNDKGIKIIYHNGWWHGYKTSITRFIEDKNTIIILNNTNSHIMGIISDMEKVLYSN